MTTWLTDLLLFAFGLVYSNSFKAQKTDLDQEDSERQSRQDVRC